MQSRIVLLDGSPEQNELQLTGLVVKEGAYLKVANKIYAEIFRPWWVDRRLTSLCPYQTMLEKWLSSKCDPRWLLNEQNLQEARTWAGTQSLSEEHHQFLMSSQSHIYEQTIARQEARRKNEKEQMRKEADAIATRHITQVKRLFITSLILFTLSGIILTITLVVALRPTVDTPKQSKNGLSVLTLPKENLT
ncbi:MAG: hypothetical protein AAGE59_23685 [Cyanobacteria bacterium P01_F01_bin.86]